MQCRFAIAAGQVPQQRDTACRGGALSSHRRLGPFLATRPSRTGEVQAGRRIAAKPLHLPPILRWGGIAPCGWEFLVRCPDSLQMQEEGPTSVANSPRRRLAKWPARPSGLGRCGSPRTRNVTTPQTSPRRSSMARVARALPGPACYVLERPGRFIVPDGEHEQPCGACSCSRGRRVGPRPRPLGLSWDRLLLHHFLGEWEYEYLPWDTPTASSSVRPSSTRLLDH